MENNQIEVPLSLIQALEEIRQSGKYNMFDAQGVFVELYDLGYYEEVDWLFNSSWREGSYRSQVDTKKYAAALRELGNTKEIAYKLSK